MSDSVWPAGSILHPLNVAWTSGNGRTILRLQEDRNLVLYRDGNVLFAAPNAYKRGAVARMQDDGNFVLYDRNNVALWSTRTGGNPGNPGAWLAVQDDGNMVLYAKDRRVLWEYRDG